MKEKSTPPRRPALPVLSLHSGTIRPACRRSRRSPLRLPVLFFALSSLVSGTLASESYRIAEVSYDLTGRTKEYALRLAVPIDTGRVFGSAAELEGYLSRIAQQLRNQRVIEESAVTYTVESAPDTVVTVGAAAGGSTPGGGGVTPDGGGNTPESGGDIAEGKGGSAEVTAVFVRVTAADTHNFIVLPYPKYDSNDEKVPFELKLKLKDYNFLGLMQTLNLDLNWQTNFKTGDDGNNAIGFNADYVLPFAAGPFDASWINDWSLTNTLGGSEEDGDSLEFNFTTGVKLVLPFDRVNLEFTAKHSFIRDLGDDDADYRAAGDALYMTEYLEVATPLTLHRFNNLSRLYFTPDVHFKYNWDGDGNFVSDSGIRSPDLQSKTVGVGANLHSSRVDWVGNFREGGAFRTGYSMDYNFALPPGQRYVHSINASSSGFAAWKYAGLASRLQMFMFLNIDGSGISAAEADSPNTKKIGGDLRGVKDDQLGIKTVSALILNLDLPIRVLTTDWRGWGKAIFKKESPSWLHNLDFEWQLSPFLDAALIKNAVTASTFRVRDGWYGGGLEFLVYPARFRSLTIRLSLGADLGSALFGSSFGYGDTGEVASKEDVWRRTPVCPLSGLGNKVFNEITFGVGLLF